MRQLPRRSGADLRGCKFVGWCGGIIIINDAKSTDSDDDDSSYATESDEENSLDNADNNDYNHYAATSFTTLKMMMLSPLAAAPNNKNDLDNPRDNNHNQPKNDLNNRMDNDHNQPENEDNKNNIIINENNNDMANIPLEIKNANNIEDQMDQ
jgi:hypothetical protein